MAYPQFDHLLDALMVSVPKLLVDEFIIEVVAHYFDTFCKKEILTNRVCLTILDDVDIDTIKVVCVSGVGSESVLLVVIEGEGREVFVGYTKE